MGKGLPAASAGRIRRIQAKKLKDTRHAKSGRRREAAAAERMLRGGDDVEAKSGGGSAKLQALTTSWW